MEITIDYVMDDDDYLNINHIRYIMNYLLGPADYRHRPNSQTQVAYVKEIRRLSKKA